MLSYEGREYRLENRKAKPGELIRTLIYLDEHIPTGTVVKTQEVNDPRIKEVMVGPTWYEEGMSCFGFVAFLEEEDYEVMVPIESI